MHFLRMAAAVAMGLWLSTPVWALEGGIWGRSKPKVSVPAPPPSVRVAMVEPLMAARIALQQDQHALALEQIALAEAQAETLNHLSDYERYVIARMRGAAAVGMGDMALALHHFKGVLNSPSLPLQERLPMLDVLGRLSFQQRNYAEAIQFLETYRFEGGRERESLEALTQALYLAERYADAARELESLIATAESLGEAPPEHQIELLASCALKREDLVAYRAALRKMVMYYPAQSYWMDLIARTLEAQAATDERLTLDVFRLRRHAGALAEAADYLEAAQTALKAGFPGEAQRILREGRRNGVLGHGSKEDVDFQKQFEGVVEREITTDRRSLEEGARLAAAQANGEALVNTGENYVGYGQYDKGLSLIRAGLAKGGLRQPDLTRLHLGYAQFVAGRLTEALDTFERLSRTEALADLAELWMILCRQKIEEQLNS